MNVSNQLRFIRNTLYVHRLFYSCMQIVLAILVLMYLVIDRSVMYSLTDLKTKSDIISKQNLAINLNIKESTLYYDSLLT